MTVQCASWHALDMFTYTFQPINYYFPIFSCQVCTLLLPRICIEFFVKSNFEYTPTILLPKFKNPNNYVCYSIAVPQIVEKIKSASVVKGLANCDDLRLYVWVQRVEPLRTRAVTRMPDRGRSQSRRRWRCPDFWGSEETGSWSTSVCTPTRSFSWPPGATRRTYLTTTMIWSVGNLVSFTLSSTGLTRNSPQLMHGKSYWSKLRWDDIGPCVKVYL